MIELEFDDFVQNKPWLAVACKVSEKKPGLKDASLVGDLSTVDKGTAVLSLLGPMDSALYLHLLRAAPPSHSTDDLPTSINSLIKSEVRTLLAQMKRLSPPAPKKPPPTQQATAPHFQGSWLESWMVPRDHKCEPVTWDDNKSTERFRKLQRAYLPQPPLQVSWFHTTFLNL